MEDQNELVELDIDNVAHGGVMVARLDGRVVFVSDAIPGERVLARVADDSKASFWRADTIEVLQPSPDRRPHVWSAAALEHAPEERAGGAEFGHIALERQRALKGEVLTDALRRFGGIDRAVGVEPIGADAPGAEGDRPRELDGKSGGSSHPDGSWRADGGNLHRDRTAAGGATGGAAADATRAERVPGTGWRTRVQLHVGSGGRVGPYAARSHRVVEVDDLPLATAAIEAEALETMKSLRGDAQGAAAVEFVETADGELRVSLVAEDRSKTGGRGGSGARGRRGRDSGRRTSHGRAGDPADAGGRHANGGITGGRGATARGTAASDTAATIVERVGEREFRLAENGFWQVHRDAARTLSQAVGDLTRDDLFDPRAANHDLYGGVGLLAAAIGDRFGPATRITSVESDPTATDHASENLAEWIGARAVTGRVDRYLAELEKLASADDRRRLEAATMVIDPPRSGAGKEVVGSLVRLDVAQVVYVACDPVAFARDVKLFREGGYELDAVRAYDLFPHTHHLETIGVLVKA
jgi:tRNA/tmRNA/rRNA uracil-C5-methylase (TrmA/RlmC/RlmD family)